MKIVRLLGDLFVYFCVGTVIAQLVLFAMLYMRGALSGPRFTAMMAAVYGVPLPSASQATAIAEASTKPETPSLDQVQERRLLASLDLDLRENAVDKSLVDLRNIESQVRDERKRLDQWKTSFDARLSDLASANTGEAIQELQRTLEAVSPKQAKEQLLKILESPATKKDRPMDDVVALLKAMSLEKRKKILAEFKSPEEAEKLAAILREIRLGMPDADLIRDSRSQLQQQLAPNR
jgi:hypothetical protein